MGATWAGNKKVKYVIGNMGWGQMRSLGKMKKLNKYKQTNTLKVFQIKVY